MGFIREDNKTNGNGNNNNEIKTISSKVLTTVPASDITLDDTITINNASINKDRRYYIEFLGSKKLCSLLISKNMGNCIMCNIGNYVIQVFNDSTNILISINKINTDDTTDTFTDLIIHEEEIKYLDNKYLETDLTLQNSISLGRIGDIGAGSSAIGNGVEASGNFSHAEGTNTKALNDFSHAEGDSTTASGDCSHAEGTSTTASGDFSHAEGGGTTASGDCAHAEGVNTIALGNQSHAEGVNTTASGINSHAEGYGTTASGINSHAEGSVTTASGDYSHAEGVSTNATGEYSHAEGMRTIASSTNQHVQGAYNIEDKLNKYAHIVGNGKNEDTRSNAHTLDWEGNGWYAGQVEGTNLPYTISSKVLATVTASNVKLEKRITVNSININKDRKYYIEFLGSKKLCSILLDDEYGHSIICGIGNYKIHVSNESPDIIITINKINTDDTTTDTFTDLVIYEEEIKCLDNKYLENDLVLQNSISLGRVGDIGAGSSAIGSFVKASGNGSHAEGSGTTASGESSHAEGDNTTASGNYSHAEGVSTKALGFYSHAEGTDTIASGDSSHAEGNDTIASGNYSHAEGNGTKAFSENQHVQGKLNIEDTEGKYAHIVGNGKHDKSTNWKDVRSNAHTLDWEGNAWFAGEVQANNLPYTVSSKVLATVSASNIKIDNPITINSININKDRRYYIEFLGNKKLCNLVISEELGGAIICSIGNYNIQAYNNSTNISLIINKVNEDDTTDTFTDLVIYEEEVKYLDSKYLETDLVLQNSIGLGRVGKIGMCSSAIGYDVEASGNYSHAEGTNTKALNDCSHAEGDSTTASGDYSHAEGENTVASDMGSHAEGGYTKALGEYSHAEGDSTTASGDYSHAEGENTTASGTSSHAEGGYAKASGDYSHAEGYSTTASGGGSHAEGTDTIASGNGSHAEGAYTKASSQYQHVQGKYNIEDKAGKYAHIVGNGTADKKRANAHTLDWEGNAWYAGQVEANNLPYTVSSKVLTTISASNIKLDDEITVNNVSINKDRRYYIEFLGSKKLCSLLISEKMGNCIICNIGNYSIQAYNNSTNIKITVSKINTTDTTDTFTDLVIYEEEVKYLDNKYLETDLVLQNSISLGRRGDIGCASSAIGNGVIASGDVSHAEGNDTIASGSISHAEGYQTKASGSMSHAEGGDTTASGMGSHAEGVGTTASGMSSHAEGSNTIASSESQHVQGKYNIEDKTKKYAHIVGNGEYGKKSNAHTLDWKGNAWFAGEVYVGGKSQDDGKKLLSTADIYFDENGKLCITINGVTKKFTPDSE